MARLAPEPYAKYRLRHYGYQHDRQPGPSTAQHYEDVKQLPVLQTTVTFGEGLNSPAELFGSLKRAGGRFVGADKLVQDKLVQDKLDKDKLVQDKLVREKAVPGSASKVSGHGQGRCQCRHHQQKQLQAGVEEARDQLPVITETEHSGQAGQVKGHHL